MHSLYNAKKLQLPSSEQAQETLPCLCGNGGTGNLGGRDHPSQSLHVWALRDLGRTYALEVTPSVTLAPVQDLHPGRCELFLSSLLQSPW